RRMLTEDYHVVQGGSAAAEERNSGPRFFPSRDARLPVHQIEVSSDTSGTFRTEVVPGQTPHGHHPESLARQGLGQNPFADPFAWSPKALDDEFSDPSNAGHRRGGRAFANSEPESMRTQPASDALAAGATNFVDWRTYDSASPFTLVDPQIGPRLFPPAG